LVVSPRSLTPTNKERKKERKEKKRKKERLVILNPLKLRSISPDNGSKPFSAT
jgi:hypothetical protein